VYNKYVNVFKTAARWLFVLCLPVLLITASIAIAVNTPALYTRGFHRYHISAATGLDMSQLEKAAAGLRDYFNNGQEYIDIVVMKDGQPFTLFKQIEVDHLKDVKALFRLDYKAAGVTLLYVIAFTLAALFWWRDRRQLWVAMRNGGILTLVLMVALGITILVDFNGFFIEFHLLSFANNFWELNPATDYLVMMFPEPFWSDATAFIAAGAAGAAVIIGAVGWWRARRAAAGD
jgi:integral membrane protein (TIGR01906 family)